MDNCDCKLLVDSNNGQLKANSEIAGIGVLLGVMLPALIVSVLIAMYYSLFLYEDGDDVCTDLDKAVLKYYRKRRPGSTKLTPEMLRKFILLFSDVQLVNGFAMLMSGFLQGCSVSAYHWEILVECVWFTSATHLATIPILHSFLADPRHRLLIWFRLILMTVIFAMLIAISIPTGHAEWLNVVATPARCYFNYSFDDGSEQGVGSLGNQNSPWAKAVEAILLTWSLGILILVYIRRAVPLFRLLWKPQQSQVAQTGCFTAIKTYLNTFISDTQNQIYDPTGTQEVIKLVGSFILLTLFLTLRTAWRLLVSFLWHIIWLFLTIIWGVYLIIYNKWFFHNVTQDNEWTYGQFFPLFLLLLPALGMLEIIFDVEDTRDTQETANVEENVQNIQHFHSNQKEDQRDAQETANDGENVGNGQRVHNNEKEDHIVLITTFIILEIWLVFALLMALYFVITPIQATQGARPYFFTVFISSLFALPFFFTGTLMMPNVLKKLRLGKGRRKTPQKLAGRWVNILFAIFYIYIFLAVPTIFFAYEFMDLFEQPGISDPFPSVPLE